MRILVLSDSHGNKFHLSLAIEKQPRARHVIFLGDGERDLDDLLPFYEDRIFHRVRGNCDLASLLPLEGVVSLSGKRIFYTHGQKYQVKFGTWDLCQAARGAGADICLFGHTHQPLVDYCDGLHLLNPGSIGHSGNGNPSYGIIDITDAGIVCKTVKLVVSM